MPPTETRVTRTTQTQGRANKEGFSLMAPVTLKIA